MLAIIIPYYKLTFFETTLQSLANQTDKRFKVYIGDDASPEDCSDLIIKFNLQINLFYKRFDDNLGRVSLVKHWERCIELIDDYSIEWVQILGDDDVLGENVVEEFYKNSSFFIKERCNVIRCATQKIDYKNNKISDIYYYKKIDTAINFLFKLKRSSLSENFFNLKILKKVKFKDFPLAWCSDTLSILEVSGFNNIYHINDAIIYIRLSNLSISGKDDNLILKRKASLEYLNYLINNYKTKFNREQLLVLKYERIKYIFPKSYKIQKLLFFFEKIMYQNKLWR